MLATNHALSGALIAAFMPLPVAIPLAFASHFVLDAIPHYGIKQQKRNKVRSYKMIVYGDTFIALSIAASAAFLHKWAMEAMGWWAWSPDLLWVYYFFRHGRSLHIKPLNRFMRFHAKIQTERPWGMYIELVVMAIMMPIFIVQLLA